jgi:hypothetical protein
VVRQSETLKVVKWSARGVLLLVSLRYFVVRFLYRWSDQSDASRAVAS